MSKEVTFNVKVTMNERWVDDFCSMLRYMEWCGNIGHSSLAGFYADGDGDFRPKFEIDREYELKEGIPKKKLIKRKEECGNENSFIPEVMFDAG